MSVEVLPTKFAPAQRAEATTLAEDVARFRNDALAVTLLAAAPGFYLILNEERQIVFASESMLALPGVTSLDDVIGLRPGEALRCEHATAGNAARCAPSSAV
jgi:PAS domain-containing protein